MKSSEYVALKKKERETTEIPVRHIDDEQIERLAQDIWQGKQETDLNPPKTHKKEEKVSEPIEYDKGITMPVFYAFVFVAFSVILFLSVTKYQVTEKTKTEIQTLRNSTGAIIDGLLQEKAINQKEWEKQEKLKELAQKQIDSSTIKQAEYNASTYRIDEEIKKFGISITQ